MPASPMKALIDFNRTGTPLLEIVSHPDISSAYEAREYLKALHGHRHLLRNLYWQHGRRCI